MTLVPKELVKDLLNAKVFYFHQQRGWDVGTIQNLGVQENRAGVAQVILTIRSTEDDQHHDLVFKPSLIHKCTGGVDDMAPDNLLTLPQLHHGLLVHVLRLRHSKDVIYTNLGELVIAINPFKYSIPWYQDAVMEAYLDHLHQTDIPSTILPHTWAVAHRAYVSMSNLGANHSIVISGESGSGKTESCKTMLKYLCCISEKVSKRRSNSQAASAAVGVINEKVQLSNVVLEAFGNAKTLRNDNSSRFGKLTEVQFSSSGQLVGMRTTPFLLERSRVVHCGMDERVFHCFYQLVAGAGKELQSELRLRSARDFQLLGQGKCISLKSSGVDDAKDFKKVCAAMGALGFTHDEVRSVWQVVAAVAHLQNLQFVDHASNFGRKASEEAELEPSSVELASFVAKDLLSLADPLQLQLALVTSTSIVKGEAVVRKLSTQKAMDQRDSISKLLYARLFLWIVHRINAFTAYRPAEDDGEAAANDDAPETGGSFAATAGGGGGGGPGVEDDTPRSWIALLDIFGFEDFPNNSFEQFCINLANESLQRHYTKHHFVRDVEDMRKEGITTHQVKFVDNAACVELLQGAKNSVISVLDDCSTLDLERGGGGGGGGVGQLSANQNAVFLHKLTQLHRPEYQTAGSKGGSKSVLERGGGADGGTGDSVASMEKPSDYFYRGRLDDDSFTIRHYACDVKYKVDGFIEKNMDHVRESSLTALRTTTNAVLQEMLDMDENIGLLADLPVGSPGSPRGGGAGSPSRGGAGKKTVSSQFRNSLKLLMDTLDQSSPHWVRCIRPHTRKSPNLFDGKLVLEQLVATGVLATIEQRQRNFPFRIGHADFVQRFGVLAMSTLRRLGPRTSNQERCSCILSALRVAANHAGTATTAAAIGGEDTAQVGHSKVFLSTKTMESLERERVALLDSHVMCVSMYARCFQARKVACKILWTLHAVRMQRLARRTLRIRRCVTAYYAELCQRILGRHLQEQKDLMHTEAKARPRIVVEEQQAFYDTSRVFRSLLVPMISTVLKNVRAVEGATREEVHDEAQRGYWALEVHFAEGVVRANEARKARLLHEQRLKQDAIQHLASAALAARGRLAEQEAQEWHQLRHDVLPKVRAIQAAASHIRQQQKQRDAELQRLYALRQHELRRLARNEARRVEDETHLWRQAVGEDTYLSELAAWRNAPPGAHAEFMKQFGAARLPSTMLSGGGPGGWSASEPSSVSSMSDAARVLLDAYRLDLSRRAATVAVDVNDPRGLRDVVLGAADAATTIPPSLSCVVLPPPPVPPSSCNADGGGHKAMPPSPSHAFRTPRGHHRRRSVAYEESSDDELELLRSLERPTKGRGSPPPPSRSMRAPTTRSSSSSDGDAASRVHGRRRSATGAVSPSSPGGVRVLSAAATGTTYRARPSNAAVWRAPISGALDAAMMAKLTAGCSGGETAARKA